jgi:hypothetical protein
MNESKVWYKTVDQKINSLIEDESKNNAMISALHNTVTQLRAKSTFRLALLNQIKEENERKNK